jgi:FkbM family methyltransferase
MIIPILQVASKYSLPPMKQLLHIGGHYGEEFEDYRSNGVENQTWVEPALESFLEMRKRIGMRGCTRLFHCALGSFNGFEMMHVERDNSGQSSSILAPKLHATQYPTVRFLGERELVTVMRADDLFHGEAFDFIAIDVQGYELEALHGAYETLDHVQAISAEINREELYEGCGLVGQVDAFLADRGFDRVETEWCGGTWGEGIYVRRRPPA